MSKLIEEISLQSDGKPNGTSYVMDTDDLNGDDRPSDVGVMFWGSWLGHTPAFRSTGRDLRSDELTQIAEMLKAHETNNQR